MDENSLLYWFFKVKDLGIPVPKTEIVRLSPEEIQAYQTGEEDCFNLDRLESEIRKVVEKGFVLPVFLRTDQYSHKHYWKKSCYLNDLTVLSRHLFEIISGSANADFLGLPLEAIVVREFIPMDSRFHAFSEEMPVNPERRYFIRNGKILCHHPYWIPDAILKGTPKRLPDNWRELLTERKIDLFSVEGLEQREKIMISPLPINWKEIGEEINYESKEEIILLTDYSSRVAKAVSGFWSVDFCRAKDKRWILIDMALGEKSWHPEGCKYCDKLDSFYSQGL